MAIFQIYQLNSTENISIDQQKQVYGLFSSNRDGTVVAITSSEKEVLWQGYADGDYSLAVTDDYGSRAGTHAVFTTDGGRGVERIAGAIMV
jgi:hypothetical protein